MNGTGVTAKYVRYASRSLAYLVRLQERGFPHDVRETRGIEKE